MFPKLFQIGQFALPTYGLLVAVAFLVALWMASRFAAERGLNQEKIVNLGVYCALMGMLGAKVLMIALDPEYRAHPAEIFTLATLQSAGIFFGGFIAAFIFAVVYMYRQKMPVLATCDIFAPGVAIGHGIGRRACDCTPPGGRVLPTGRDRERVILAPIQPADRGARRLEPLGRSGPGVDDR